ncbi:MAG: glycosyltransferase family 4 protein [Candidatus Brocadiaceae bacterium]|nr:glycosyltransferase family 4 protein [Candidatus Brocadiaceae bacterium]
MPSPEVHGRPRVLLLTEALAGGVERHLRDLVGGLPADRYEVHVAAPPGPISGASDCLRPWRNAGRPVHEVPMRKRIAPVSDVRAFRALLALCRRERYAIVHTHSAKAGFLGRLAGRLTGAATVHTPHVPPFDRGVAPVSERLYLFLERRAARWTDHMVLLSRYQENLVLRRRLLPAQKLTVIPNGQDAEATGLPDRRAARRELGLAGDETIVLQMGRFCRQKGQEVLIEATALARRQGAALRVLMVGDGPTRPQLQARIRSAGLEGVVALEGWTAGPGLYYAASDLVAMPSWFEGGPYVLLEARAAARATAVSLCCGMEEFVRHGVDGFLLPPGNGEAWARLLLRAARERDDLDRIGRQAQARARQEPTVREAVERLTAVYDRLLGRRAAG